MISVSLNRFSSKALVHKDGTWIFVKGEVKPDGSLVYLHNGRVEISREGYYIHIRESVCDEDCQIEVVKRNIHQYTRLARPGQRS
jgi:hypothetical protein